MIGLVSSSESIDALSTDPSRNTRLLMRPPYTVPRDKFSRNRVSSLSSVLNPSTEDVCDELLSELKSSPVAPLLLLPPPLPLPPPRELGLKGVELLLWNEERIQSSLVE